MSDIERKTTLERAIIIIELLSKYEKLALSEIAAILHIPNGTTFNILKSLNKYNLIEREKSSKKFQLGFKLFQLGNKVTSIKKLCEAALPFMRELTKESGETSHLGVLIDNSIYFLEIVESPNTTKTRVTTGLNLPLYAPAVGKVLLAYQNEQIKNEILKQIEFIKFTQNTITDLKKFSEELNNIKKNGYAIDNEEVYLGTMCIAAPVFDSDRFICAGLGITGDKERINTKKMNSIINLVQHEAMNISFKLGCCVE
jgi:DNA-binding IclR family transcriptional regulator